LVSCAEILKAAFDTTSRWNFNRRERVYLSIACCLLVLFGFLLERRTALRDRPMTDLGVFCFASGAIWSGENPYAIADSHGWHYQYPPVLAIMFLPFAEPPPLASTALPPDKPQMAINVTKDHYFGLHASNAHFAFTVVAWYVLSTLGILLSAHALACAMEGSTLRSPPPGAVSARRRWWWRRLLPLVVCAGSLVTDLARGQVDILMLVAIALGLYFVAVKKNLQAGLCLAFPATVKLFPPLLLAYPFYRRQWRMAAGVVGGLLIFLMILPLAALGPKRTTELYHCWFEVLAKPALGEGTDTSRQQELTGMGRTDNQSLLAIIHNWTYRSLSHHQRPTAADPWARDLVYAIGALMIIMMFRVMGFRQADAPHDLLVISGLLIGIGLLVNPIVHNFYYLLMLPLVAALIDSSLLSENRLAMNWKLLLPVIVFMLADLLARVPVIGLCLRDYGMTTLSLIFLMCAGVAYLNSHTRFRRPATT